VVVVHEAQTDQVCTVRLELDAERPGDVRHRVISLDPFDFLFGNAHHLNPPFSKTCQGPPKKNLRLFFGTQLRTILYVPVRRTEP
jgi:hypothetical protein